MTERLHEKRHANAWDQKLPSDDARDEVFRRATQGHRWDQVAAWVSETYGLPAPGRSAFYDFIGYWRSEYLARRIQERVLARDVMREERAKIGDMAPELVQSLEDQGGALIAAGQVDVAKTLFGIAKDIREDTRKRLELDLKQQAEERAKQDVEIKLRRLELLERKMAEAGDKGEQIDPKRLADEIDRTLGRKTP
jgi:hypothetical protein